MSYSCSDFVDSILDALKIEVPEESQDSPSDQADLALAAIEKLKSTLAECADFIESAANEIDDPAGATAFVANIRALL